MNGSTLIELPVHEGHARGMELPPAPAHPFSNKSSLAVSTKGTFMSPLRFLRPQCIPPCRRTSIAAIMNCKDTEESNQQPCLSLARRPPRVFPNSPNGLLRAIISQELGKY
jgi:hypothetical protein